jgi:hypothetical protein
MAESIWLLTEHQRGCQEDFLMGVFSSPEAAIRWLRTTSSRWPEPVKTSGFSRYGEHLWMLGSPDDRTSYSICCWQVDDPQLIERGSGLEGATA